MKPGRFSYENALLILLLTGSLIFYGFFYENHLIQREQLQLFELSFSYFIQLLSVHGGFAAWTGEFLTQFFGLPFAGAIIITGLAWLIYFLTRRVVYRINSKTPSLICILPSAICLLLLQDNFFYVSGMTGIAIAFAAILPYLKAGKLQVKRATGLFMLFVVYWLAGGAYLVFGSMLILNEILSKPGDKKVKAEVLFLFTVLFFVIVIPLTARHILFTDTLLQSFLSGSYYSISTAFPLPLIMIFCLFPLLTLMEHYIPDKDNDIVKAASSLSVPIILVIMFLSADHLAESQLEYDNLVYRGKWEKIISKAEKENPYDRISLSAVNLALAEKGELSEKLFLFRQGPENLFLGYERKGMTPFLAGEPCYRLGLFNFAQMFAMETIESTPDAKYPARAFKRVAETFLINGQYDIAMKYLQPLRRTLFYRSWADKYIGLIEGGNIDSDTLISEQRSRASRYDFYYDPSQADMSMKFLLLSNPSNHVAFEYLMADYLLKKDLDGFLQGLQLAHGMKYGKLPVSWQEAASYIISRLGQVPPVISQFGISEDVRHDFEGYAAAFSAAATDTLLIRKNFGNTYWYYLHFCKP